MGINIVKSYEHNYLKNWNSCSDKLSKYLHPKDFGFNDNCKAGDLNLLNSRFRLSKSFTKDLVLDLYNKDTAKAYSKIFKLFLTYSAFEQLNRCLKVKLEFTDNLNAKYEMSEQAEKIREINGYDIFLKKIKSNLNEKLKKSYESFLSGESNYLLNLSSGVRHIFAHGFLSAYAGSDNQNIAIDICIILDEMLMKVIDGEFSLAYQT